MITSNYIDYRENRDDGLPYIRDQSFIKKNAYGTNASELQHPNNNQDQNYRKPTSKYDNTNTTASGYPQIDLSQRNLAAEQTQRSSEALYRSKSRLEIQQQRNSLYNNYPVTNETTVHKDSIRTSQNMSVLTPYTANINIKQVTDRSQEAPMDSQNRDKQSSDRFPYSRSNRSRQSSRGSRDTNREHNYRADMKKSPGLDKLKIS